MNGIFISFEGIDGAGKSSHIETLADAFRARSGARQVIVTREPGGTKLGEALREMILHQAMDDVTEALLMFAARREHVVQVIAPALMRGDVVLCDRFTDASFAYQGAGRGFDLKSLSFLELLSQDVRGFLNYSVDKNAVLQPDLTLLFEVPPAVAAERLAKARKPDRFESQSQAFFERVAAGYAARLATDPGRFARIDGQQDRERVRMQVMQAVKSKGLL